MLPPRLEMGASEKNCLSKAYNSKIQVLGDFLGGPMVENLPAKSGDMNSTPGWGTKILHTVGQLSQFTTTTEPGL